jgi:N6-L-threonylcarbamoyladenine synthase
MKILGIETSCDETAAAVVDGEGRVLSDVVHTQVAIHAPYGGVVPELASRDHIRRMLPLIRHVLGLHKEFGKRRMRRFGLVRTVSVHHQP